MDGTIADFERVLSEAPPSLFREKEKTIFEVGGAAYYENPASDMLAFFLDPSKPHGFNALFLRAFWAHMKLKDAPDLDRTRVLNVQREPPTETLKRPDIIVEGTNWVLLIENKIRHMQNNPFDEYEAHASKAYSGKTPYYAILSPSGRSVRPKTWEGVSYRNYLCELKASLGTTLLNRSFSKWDVFARELILHLENQATEQEMEPNERKFAEKNYAHLVKMAALPDKYVNQVAEEGKQQLNTKVGDCSDFESIQKDWGGYAALEFRSDKWVSNPNGPAVFIHFWNASVQGMTVGIWLPDAAVTSHIEEQLNKVASFDSDGSGNGCKSWSTGRQDTVAQALSALVDLANLVGLPNNSRVDEAN